MLPIRCFTCGKVIANKEELFLKLKKENKEPKEIFKILGFSRYCCKRMIMSSIDTSKII